MSCWWHLKQCNYKIGDYQNFRTQNSNLRIPLINFQFAFNAISMNLFAEFYHFYLILCIHFCLCPWLWNIILIQSQIVCIFSCLYYSAICIIAPMQSLPCDILQSASSTSQMFFFPRWSKTQRLISSHHWLPSFGRHNNDCPVISTYEYIMLHGKRELRLQMES